MFRPTIPCSIRIDYTYIVRRQVQQIIPPAGGTTSFTYNTADDQLTRTDGACRTWTTEYDTRRLVTRITDPLGYFIRHQYDENGNRTATWDAKSQQTGVAPALWRGDR